MKRHTSAKFALQGSHGQVHIERMANGFPHIQAESEEDVYYGLGYMHGFDRQMQMWLLKLIGRGRASECLRADEELIEIDKFMRWINLAGDAEEDVAYLTAESGKILEAYCRGANEAVAATGPCFEFKLTGYRPDHWMPADVLLMAKLIGYVNLAQSQGDIEKFIIQMLQKDVSVPKIKELFAYLQEDIPDSLLALLKKVRGMRPLIPESVRWLNLAPGFFASNNWAIAPAKTASGKAILCGDPHLALQLPAIWYLAVLKAGERFVMGATVPGVPIVALGRTQDLAWAVTYGMADVSDYHIEEIKDKKRRSGEEWVPFAVREEVIRPKKKKAMTLHVYESEHGLLEGTPDEDGYYLSYAWTTKLQKGTAAESLDRFFKIEKAKNVAEAMEHFAHMRFASFNWVMADSDGNIGYQMSGLVPRRPAGISGLLPLPGWEPGNHWTGTIAPENLPRQYNPESGFIATANQDLNRFGKEPVITVPMSNYRADRISALLKDEAALSSAGMKQMHYDRYSLQAEAFMQVLRPLLPESEKGKLLQQWNLRYDADSVGATLFENVYRELLLLVFGDNGFGREVMGFVMEESLLFAMIHGNFDQVLLQESSEWFGGKDRASLYREAIARGLEKPAPPHARTRKFYMPHLFFGGKLPKFLGFDYEIEHIGSRATVPQSQIFSIGGRPATFAATFRMICDFAYDELLVNLAGGASDRRFSKHYTQGIAAWLKGEYAKMTPQVVRSQPEKQNA